MLTRSYLVVCAALIGLASSGCKKDDAKPSAAQDDAAAVAAPAHDARPAGDLTDAAAMAEADGAVPAGDGDAATAAAPADAGTRTAGGDQTGAGAGDDDKLTNIKVLPKGWSKDKVNAYMKNEVSKGLGVKCDFCHVKGDFASDANEHKIEARKMIVLTQDANKKFFKGKPEVKCVTCHHGQEHPPE